MITFSFGRNWKRFIEYVANEEILLNAQNSLVRFLGEDFEFRDKVFVDIGCGSGIFSIAALRLGCSKVLSVDIDKQSIEATLLAREKFAPQASENWEIFQGNILEDSSLETLKQKIGDKKIIVYSWGVLHHTGALQKAMNNVMTLVSGGGGNYAYIALYNQTEASAWWLRVKEYYNKTNPLMKFLMVVSYTFFLTFEDIRKGRGLNMYDKNRGMYKITDIIDWLGGLPYEPILNDEVLEIWEKRGFACVKNHPTIYYKPTYPKNRFYKLFIYLKVVGLGCNEFCFKSRD